MGLNGGNFYLQATVIKFGDLLGVCKLETSAKFQLNISIVMPTRPKTTGIWGTATILLK